MVRRGQGRVFRPTRARRPDEYARTRGNDACVRAEQHTHREFDLAFERLYTTARAATSNFFRDDTAAAADALEQTMAQAYEHWESARAHGDPVAWVLACAKDVCVARLRAHVRNGDGSRHDVLLWDALRHLRTRERDVAVLQFLMGCNVATTAAALGTSVARINGPARRARRRLNGLAGTPPSRRRAARRVNARRVYAFAVLEGRARRRRRRQRRTIVTACVSAVVLLAGTGFAMSTRDVGRRTEIRTAAAPSTTTTAPRPDVVPPPKPKAARKPAKKKPLPPRPPATIAPCATIPARLARALVGVTEPAPTIPARLTYA